MRVVALTCSNTEIVCALGCAEFLVGVDRHSDYPHEVVRSLPRVGPDLDIDVAAVAALKPDLVLASLTVPGHERIVERLERAKLPFIAPEPKNLEDVYADVLAIARRLDREARGQELVNAMRRELDVRSLPSGKRILVEWWPKPIISPGADSWVDAMLVAAGALNPLTHRAVKSTPLSDEDAARLAPDAVVIAWCGVRLEKYRPDVVLRRPAFRELELVKRRRVYPISEAWLGRPGPRLVEGVRALRGVVAELTQAGSEL